MIFGKKEKEMKELIEKLLEAKTLLKKKDELNTQYIKAQDDLLENIFKEVEALVSSGDRDSLSERRAKKRLVKFMNQRQDFLIRRNRDKCC